MNKLLRIKPADNVWIVCRHILPGDEEEMEGQKVVFDKPLGLGHKIAAKDIVAGETIIKFGISIGTAVENIALGTHVHLHNMKSNYISTYTLDHEFIKNK